MALEDGAGVRSGSDATIRLIFTQSYRPLDLSPAGRTVTIECELNGGTPFSPTSVTKISLDGVETAGTSGVVDVLVDAGDLTAAGTLTMEATVGGAPAVNPNQKTIKVPVRDPHSDAP